MYNPCFETQIMQKKDEIVLFMVNMKDGYVVEQKYFPKLRYGYRNNDIMQLVKGEGEGDFELQENKLLRSYLEHAYTMLQRDEELTLYKEKFTPEFYPNRFIIKDDIYSMYPEILTTLLAKTILDYMDEKVYYVEYSVSLNDLMNANVRKHLEESAVVEEFKKLVTAKTVAVDENKNDEATDEVQNNSLEEIDNQNKFKKFKYYFLGALNRRAVQIYGEDETEEDMYQYFINSDINKLLERAFDEQSFTKIITNYKLKDPDSLLKSLNVNQNELNNGDFVGFDWVGDEMLHPFCVFGVGDLFKNIAKEYFHIRNRPLGLRLHCGENLVVDEELYARHMKITQKTIENIRASSKIDTDNGPTEIIKYRLGHGVAFLADGENGEYEQFREGLVNESVCFEWCPVSNKILLYAFQAKAIPIEKYFSCMVVGTDNHGIFENCTMTAQLNLTGDLKDTFIVNAANYVFGDKLQDRY